MKHLLVLDDDDLVGDFVQRLGADMGYAVRVSVTAEAFREHFRAHAPDEIVLDLRLGDSDGVEVLRFLSAQGCKSRITLLSGIDNRTLDAARSYAASLGLNVGAALSKPVRAADLRAALLRRDMEEPALNTAAVAAGIQNRELVLEYQPIISCATGKLSSLEALVRWQRPDGARVAPDQFIPLAETDPDLMDKLTFEVARLVAQDWPSLQRTGYAGQIGINISAQNLHRLDFPERLSQHFQKSGLSTDRIKLEMTESAAMTDPQATLDILVRLRLKGFTLTVDDFGTGFSSLVMLRRLPYSDLKIDRSFVKDVLISRDAMAIVKAVLALAQNMGLQTVAEGVEDSQILALLTELGTTYAQGYGISRPLVVPKLVDWITAQNPPHSGPKEDLPQKPAPTTKPATSVKSAKQVSNGNDAGISAD